MGKYTAHFSYYSEDTGRFETQPLIVYGADVFEARAQAWVDWDNWQPYDNAPIASCVKLCGITWDASPLNLPDYLNAQAAYYRCAIKEIQNTDLNNDEIEGNEESMKRHRDDIYGLYGGLNCVYDFARDLAKPHDMPPPTIHEELHYALKLVDILDQRREREQAQALMEIIQNAEKWDSSAMLSLTLLFREGSMWLNGEAAIFYDQFQKGGAYPVNADSADWDFTYVNRHKNVQKVSELSRLPSFDGEDVIKNSAKLDYEYRTLVLRQDGLNEPYKTPENLLWTPCEQDEPLDKAPNATFYAKNLITGEEDCWNRSDFHGVLRPEYNDNIDFDALHKEYAAAHPAAEREDELDGELDEDDEQEGEF